MPTLAGLDGGSLLPDFMGSVEKGMDFRKKVDQRRLVPDLVKRARDGDQEAINQLVTLDPDTLRNALTMPALGDTTRATQETAKLQALQAQAGQERVRLLKIKANLGAAVAGGPENLRVNLAKMAEGRISEDDPDFNLDEVAEMMQMATTEPEKAFARLQEEATSVGSQLSTINQILGAGKEAGFTLGEGQQRFDAQGNLVASGAPKVNKGRDSLTQVQSSQILPDGSTVQVFKDGSTRVTGPQGRPLMGQEREDAVVTAQEFGIDVQSQRAGGRTEATETEKRNSALVVRGIAAAESTAIVRRALNLLDTVKTGGVNAIALATRQRLGIEGANEGELSNSLGKSVLSQLRETFGAAFTESEGKRLERIEAGFGKSPETNRRLLTQALRIAENTANRAAKVASDGEKADIEELLTFSLEVDDVATGQGSAPGAGNFQSTSGITFTVEE